MPGKNRESGWLRNAREPSVVKGEGLVFDFWRVLDVFDDQLESCVPAHHSLAGAMLRERLEKLDRGGQLS